MVSCVIPTGFLLSEFNLINQALAWGISINILALLFNVFFRQIADNQDFNLNVSIKGLPRKFFHFWKSQAFLGKITFGILFIGVGITTIINLIIFFITVPNEWDSMTGHLVKCAYYLQNGNMNRLQGTTWTIDFYPNSLPTLQIFGYHIFGEKGFKVIHYLSYWIFAISSYGIVFKISKNFTASFFVFLLTSLLPTALVQATTTETDIVLTAYLGCLTYFLFCFKNTSNKLIISLIALMSGIWIGHKVTFLLIAPAIFVVTIYTVLTKKEFYKHLMLFISVLIFSIGIYVLPTGYLGNVKEVGKFSLGSLSAPKEVMSWHGIERYSGKEITKYGTINTARYVSDFLNFDGLRSTDFGQKMNDKFRYFPDKAFSKMHLTQDKFWVVAPFGSKYEFYRERPFWGIISFGMVFPLMFFVMIGFFKNPKNAQNRSFLVLIIAAILHFLSLSFTAPYDPIKARYFMNVAVWCLPILSLFFQEKISRMRDFYLLFCCIIISISAILTTTNRRLYPLFGEKNIFTMNRMEQMTISRPEIYEVYQKFDEIVPKNAIVALGTQQEHEDFEYPLWGENFKRKLIPLHPFRSAVKPIPVEAEYLFYSKGVFEFKDGDILLGSKNAQNDTPVEESEFYLRKLKKH